MKFCKILWLFLFICFCFSVVWSEQRTVYFYFDNQFMIIYHDNFDKLWVDINSGFVIKPEEQERKIKLVEYILNVNNFISRDEEVFTKLYIFKRSINFDFNDVEPTNLDYYSWGPLTYKYLSIFCKNVKESITIRIPSFDLLPNEYKKDIINRYRLVFGTTFNEPRYLPYDITFRYFNKDEINVGTTNLTVSTDSIDSTISTISNDSTSITSDNTTNVPISKDNDNKSILNNRNFLFLIILFSVFFIFVILLFFVFRYFSFYRLKNLSSKEEFVANSNALNQSIVNLSSEIDSIKKSIGILENNISQVFRKIEEISSKVEKMIEQYEKTTNLQYQDNTNESDNIIDEQDNYKSLDRESIEVVMFKIDSLINKIKNLEIYKELDINIKATKVVSDLYDFKNSIRQNKSINLLQWDNFIKNFIIDLLSTLDKYLKKLGYNENITKIRKEIMDQCDIEEIYVVLNQTRVNIMDHRVEGYSRNNNLPNGVITEVKETGYKYKGITVKRSKVIENRV